MLLRSSGGSFADALSLTQTLWALTWVSGDELHHDLLRVLGRKGVGAAEGPRETGYVAFTAEKKAKNCSSFK